MKTSFHFTLAALAGAVSASVILDRSTPALGVGIKRVGNTQLKVTISNTGVDDLNLLSLGSLLDPSPVQKVSVYSNDIQVPFAGMHKQLATQGFSDNEFSFLPAGQSISVNVDIATIYDVTTGGVHQVFAEGAIPVAAANSTTIISYVAYESNRIELDVDGREAAAVFSASRSLSKRATLEQCSDPHKTAIRSALSHCQDLAHAGAVGANNGGADKFNRWFGNAGNRNRVNNCLSSVAQECGQTGQGPLQIHCNDVDSACRPGVVAYTVSQATPKRIVICPIYYSEDNFIRTCRDVDQSTSMLHEMTHAKCGSQDIAYGYQPSVSLGPDKSVNNADNYVFYSKAVFFNC